MTNSTNDRKKHSKSSFLMSMTLCPVIGALRFQVNASEDPSSTPSLFFLQTSLCRGYCEIDCRVFRTPLNQCYNAKQSFPMDPSWSKFDILDEIVVDRDYDDDSMSSFRRMIFETTNSTCGSTDFDCFILPADGSCVGPFGKPRPWGNFSVIEVPVRAEMVEAA